MDDLDNVSVKVLDGVSGVDPAAWNRCANPDPARFNPFVSHAFLKSLEDSKSVGGGTGWLPKPVAIEASDGTVLGVAPVYLKTHSQGEYVFDYAWADTYERAGGRYYPKLQVAVPFSPVPGPRLLTGGCTAVSERELLLGAALAELTTANEFSSTHITFCTEHEAESLTKLGYLVRYGQQFHWHNHGYQSFDDFLATFASRKRKAVRKERAAALDAGIEIELSQGNNITAEQIDAMFRFYMDTGNRKWGRPYLTRSFFTLLVERMCQHCLLVLARRNGTYIAGALNMIGGDCLYGRYWGAIEHHPCLHFEVCYYQAIDYAIAHGLTRVEAGAQGEHKLARGYVPVTTYSAHWIANTHLRRAIERHLMRERAAVIEANSQLQELAPYRHGAFED